MDTDNSVVMARGRGDGLGGGGQRWEKWGISVIVPTIFRK